MIDKNEDNKSTAGKHIYLGRNASKKVNEYRKKSGQSFIDAVNEMLTLNGATSRDIKDDNQASRADIEAINRRMDVFQALVETALLELIETSAHIRKVSQSVDGVDEFGKKERAKFEMFFRQLRKQ